MEEMEVKLVVFDLAGTTVDDYVNGLPLVTVAMQESFTKHNFAVTPSQVNVVRGMDKREAISKLLQYHEEVEEINKDKIDVLFGDFKQSLNKHLESISKEIPGTTEVFKKLRDRGIKIGLGSGFPQDVVSKIVQNLNWSDLADFVSSAEKEGNGRPNPSLIKSAMAAFEITDAKHVVKVGDTKLDVLEGKNAGCWTVAVLTGTQGADTLKEVSPDFVVSSVIDLPNVIEEIEGRL